MWSHGKTYLVIRVDIGIYILLTASDKRKISAATVIVKWPFHSRDVDNCPLTSVKYVYHHDNIFFVSLLLFFKFTMESLGMFVVFIWFSQDNIYNVHDKMSTSSSTCFLKKIIVLFSFKKYFLHLYSFGILLVRNQNRPTGQFMSKIKSQIIF